ncbi:restriction endonuclease [Patescibacteria group bacterium]|nr:restriction endonuclease [Patescibacteria group bacterium]
MKITKASGEQELYSRQKLCNSLRATGAPKALVDRVCYIVEKEISPGMTTQEIFEKTQRYLAKENPILAAKYSLKQGIMELGPSGFLFEKYVGAILKEYGYIVKTNQMMRGKSGIFHEIDILAHTKDTHYIIEAKYHNKRGIKTDVKVVMYTFARFLDIENHQRKREKEKHKAWLFTNTKFTRSAIRYALHKNIQLTGWKYPKKESLEKLIEAKSLYPVTVLPSVNRYAREQFAKHNLYFAKDLINLTSKQFQRLFAIKQKIAQNIQKEATELCE